MQGSKQQSGLSNLAGFFPTGSRTKGESYYRSRRVTIDCMEDSIIAAKVRGSGGSHYDVRIDVGNPKKGLVVACSCPHYSDGNLCKHLWATLLAADKEGMLSALAGIKQGKIYGDLDLLDICIGDGDEFDIDPKEASFHQTVDAIAKRFNERMRGTDNPSRQPKNVKVNNWRRAVLAAPVSDDSPFRGLTESVRKEQRILYAIDLSASVAAGGMVIELMQQESRKDGQWGKLKSLKIRRDSLPNISSPEDRALLGELLGNRVNVNSYLGSYGWGYETGH